MPCNEASHTPITPEYQRKEKCRKGNTMKNAYLPFISPAANACNALPHTRLSPWLVPMYCSSKINACKTFGLLYFANK